jgi:adenine-specific DNA-methyltransferase
VSNAAAIHDEARQKELGAFYTPPAMAAELTRWAVRSAGDRVLDPSFGGLVFLRAAHERLHALGADGSAMGERLFGIDLDDEAHSMARECGSLLDEARLLDRDFFGVDPSDLPPMDAVVGNPPYIRYQGFNGSAKRARELMAAAGVELTRLASSWAPFVVHATSFIASGGRLAQVLPAELLHAQYAGEVVEFLRREFEQVSIAVFEERVFPGALEDVVLLFADGRGAGTGSTEVRLIPCITVDDVRRGLAAPAAPAPSRSARGGATKLLAQLLPANARDAYDHLAEDPRVRCLGELALVDIGTVTGANEFFVLRERDSSAIDNDLLRPAVCKAAQVAGARLTVADHRRLLDDDQPALMLVADGNTPEESLRTIQGHIEEGERARLHERYKCRIRDPWWALPAPNTGPPDLLLTYCANDHPRLAVNEAQVLNTNTIHGVRVSGEITPAALAAAFYNSLTFLSVELVGRSYGGGVLKLEPTEAEAVLIPAPVDGIEEVLPDVDRAIRARDKTAALDLVDGIVLGRGLGLSQSEREALRSGAERLRERRASRGKRPARR